MAQQTPNMPEGVEKVSLLDMKNKHMAIQEVMADRRWTWVELISRQTP